MHTLKFLFATLLTLVSVHALADANSAMGSVSTTRGTAPPPTSPPANGSTVNKGAPVPTAPVPREGTLRKSQSQGDGGDVSKTVNK